MRWILLGPPGSGKGTQAKRLAAAHNAAHLSTGDLLRAEVAAQSELGKTAKAFMDRGELVPDDLILKMIRARLEHMTNGGFILDGFPRTIPQAEELDRMLEEIGEPLDCAVLVSVGDDEIKARIAGRARLEGRADDTAEVIERRLQVYRSQTEPLVEYYRRDGRLVEVNGEQDIDRVYQDLETVVVG
ncbi:MAG: adenylate kinase [Candidatus Zixiibacteriota bacterium]